LSLFVFTIPFYIKLLFAYDCAAKTFVELKKNLTYNFYFQLFSIS
jgi:hypothetical protein